MMPNRLIKNIEESIAGLKTIIKYPYYAFKWLWLNARSVRKGDLAVMLSWGLLWAIIAILALSGCGQYPYFYPVDGNYQACSVVGHTGCFCNMAPGAATGGSDYVCNN